MPENLRIDAAGTRGAEAEARAWLARTLAWNVRLAQLRAVAGVDGQRQGIIDMSMPSGSSTSSAYTPRAA
jgi:hypothetical protein